MLRSRAVLWLSILVLPPLGLVLVWMREGLTFLRRLVGTFGILFIVVVELFYIYGMRVVWNGSVSPMAVTFDSRARQEARLEASRARQRADALADVATRASRNKRIASAPVSVRTPEVVQPVSYWTDFRGPGRAGIYAETEINTSWPGTGLPRLWKQPVGGGYASFTVAEGRAYTIEQRRNQEAVTAYDVRTGRELWAFSYPALFDEVLGGPGPRATPVYHEGLVYSLGANGDLYCLSAKTGQARWSKNILADNGARNIHWAMSGSPLIVDEKVIVTPGGADGKGLVSYDRLTGKAIWRSLSDRAAYTSPIVARLADKRQIVWISAERVLGAALEDGKVLWEYPFPAQMDMNCSQPVIVDGTHLFVSSAQGSGAALLEITKTGAGLAARAIWQNNRLKNKFNSSVLYQGYLYGFDEAILACVDAKTGDLKWKGGRYGYGQLLLAGGYLVVTTEDGEVVLVRATPERHQELARFPAIQGRTWNIPAIDNGLLLVRNAAEMACFRLGTGSQ
jgi:outer membrane protein assembly factor BamB